MSKSVIEISDFNFAVYICDRFLLESILPSIFVTDLNDFLLES